MRSSITRTVLLTTFAVAAAACSDSGTGPGEEQALKPQEAMEVYAELMEALSEAMSQASFNAAGGLHASLPEGVSAAVLQGDFTETYPCDEGGSITISVKTNDGVNWDTGSGSMSGTWNQKLNGCRVTISRGSVTVHGDPDLRGSFSYQFRDYAPAGGSGSFEGAYKYSGAASGRCAMKLTETISSSGSANISGTICGQPFSTTM